MKLGYDNLEDAKTKLVGTYCLYNGKAIVMKTIEELSSTPEKKIFQGYGSSMFSGRSVVFDLDDPLFNCSNYNIGYVNMSGFAGWFYRIPLKQWRQGLRYDQVRMKGSKSHIEQYVTMKASKQVSQMLENTYPKYEEAAEMLKSEDSNIVAFHKNFAMSMDRIHQDFLLEYKGTIIGYTPNLKDVKLLEECEHLMESLREVIGG